MVCVNCEHDLLKMIQFFTSSEKGFEKFMNIFIIPGRFIQHNI